MGLPTIAAIGRLVRTLYKLSKSVQQRVQHPSTFRERTQRRKELEQTRQLASSFGDRTETRSGQSNQAGVSRNSAPQLVIVNHRSFDVLGTAQHPRLDYFQHHKTRNTRKYAHCRSLRLLRRLSTFWSSQTIATTE